MIKADAPSRSARVIADEMTSATAGVMRSSILSSSTSARAVAEVERTHIESVLKSCKWNKNAAAQQLGISYKTLLNKLHAYGLD